MLDPDEDGDLVPDLCDVCPHVFDPAQADEDGDGVGDACDPEPGIPRQRIVYFDGFAAESTGWFAGSERSGGMVVLSRIGATERLSHNLPTSTSLLQLAGEIVEVGAGKQQLLLSVRSSAEDAHYIELIDEGVGRRRSIMYMEGDEFVELDGVLEPVAIATGPLEIVFDVRPDRLAGLIENGGTRPALAANVARLQAAAETALYVHNLHVRLAYAIQIDTLP